MSDNSGFKFFTFLPPELQWRIIRTLDTKTLIRLGMTSKQMHTAIVASDVLQSEIDAYRAGLHQLFSHQHLTSTDLRQTLLPSHFDATRRVGPSLQITGPESPFRTICAPSPGCRCERLFGGYFAAITEDSSLYVWDIRATPYSDTMSAQDLPSARPILEIRGMEIQDVILAPEIDLIVILCFRDDSRPGSDDEPQNTTEAVVKLLQWSTLGTQPYPFFNVAEIEHEVTKDETIAIYPGKQFLSLQHNLLALQYYVDYDYDKRRAVVWNVSTATVVYDTEKTPDPAGFRHLAVVSSHSFAVSTLSPLGNYDPSGAIEIHAVPPTSGASTIPNHPVSELVGVFELPKVLPNTVKLAFADFYTSEALAIDEELGTTFPSRDGLDYPFAPLLEAGVQVVLLQFMAHGRQFQEPEKYYLTIHNRLFERRLDTWFRSLQDPSRSKEPFVMDWIHWGPIFTRLTGYSIFSELSMTSSVCGSKICHVRLAENDEDENIACIFIDDFNDRLPCRARACSGPFAHFEPHPEIYSRRGDIWSYNVSTWLPFHSTTSSYFEFPDDHGLSLTNIIAPYALMTENAVVLCIRIDQEETTYTRKWWVLPLLSGAPRPTHESAQTNYLAPATPSINWRRQTPEIGRPCDWVCRICQTEPLSDAHVLFECRSDKSIEDQRMEWTSFIIKKHEGVAQAIYDGRAEEALDIVMRNSTLRPYLYHLAKTIKSIYFSYAAADEGGEEEHPAVQIFRQ